MQDTGFGFWDDWELYDKVTFNMFTRVIMVNPEVANIDVKTDIYSAWKRWMLVDDNNKIGQVIRVIGGDATTQGQKAGDIYFLVNGWKLQVNLGETSIAGSIFSDDFDTPLIDFNGSPVFQSLVSSLVTGIDATATSTATAKEVWEYVARTITDARLDNLDAAVSTRSSHGASDVWTDTSAVELTGNVKFLKDTEGGKWELVGNQMIFYASDNITEISRFNMFDANGNPTTTGDIYKRERV